MIADTWVSSSDLHQCLNIHVPSSPSREDCRDMNEHLQADRRPEPPSLDNTKPGGALTFLGCPLDPRVSKHERVTDVYTSLATFIHHLLKGHTVFSVMAKKEISPKKQGLYQPHAVQLFPAREAKP